MSRDTPAVTGSAAAASTVVPAADPGRSQSSAPPSERSESSAPPSRSGFRPEVQGLRAIAVGLVVLFHLWPLRWSGGYVGVDVFFVISGYLITSHIAREVEQTGRLGLTRFWARRIRRLLPAALLVLAVSAIAVRLWVPSTEWLPVFRQLAASALYIENWALAADATDYLALDNVPTIAQHYWSLSVEEQFYVTWPLLIIGLLWWQRRRWRRAAPDAESRRRVMATGLSLVALASLTWSIVSTPQNQALAYMSTFTRAWEFAAGALVALVPIAVGRWGAVAVGWTGVASVIASGLLLTETSLFPGWIALIPVAGTVLVLLAGRGGGRESVGWWLSRRPLTFLGDISYSVYLIHWPLIIVVPAITGHVLKWPEKLGIVLLTAALAWLSKTYVEDPLRVRPFLAASTRRAFAFAVAGMAVFMLVNIGVVTELGRRDAAVDELLRAGGPCVGPAALDPANGCGPVAGRIPALVSPAIVATQVSMDLFRRCQQILDSPDLITCRLGRTDNPVRRVALLGDSHASSLVPLMDALGTQLDWEVVVHTKGSCPATDARRVLPSDNVPARQRYCEAFNVKAEADVLRDPGITDIFTTAFTSTYDWASPPGRTMADPAVDGFESAYRRWSAAGKRVHVIADVPRTIGQLIPSCIAQAATPEDCANPRATAVPRDASVVAAERLADPAVSVVDLTSQFCDQRTCYAQVGGVIVYRDKSHLSVEYSRLLAPFVVARLRVTDGTNQSR